MAEQDAGAGRGLPSADGNGQGQGQGAELAEQLGAVARLLAREQDLDATLGAIVHAAAGTVPGAEAASISVTQGRRSLVTRASTGDLATGVDRAQYESGQGPCLDTLYEQATVRMVDCRHEQRWPDFVRRAWALGVGSMLSVQLFVDKDELGVLNLIATSRDAFSDESEHVALLFASHAAVAMLGAQRQETLERGLDTRDLIGQAKGILAERYRISGDAAFAVLVRYSQNSNRKLSHIARELVERRHLPGETPPARR